MARARVVRTNSTSDDVRPVTQRLETVEQLRRLLEVAAALDTMCERIRSVRRPAARQRWADCCDGLTAALRGPRWLHQRVTTKHSGKVTGEQVADPAAWHKLFVKPLPAPWSMLDNEKLQLAGPLVVISAVTCAEFGAHALAYWPSSSLLWYLNLEVFRPVQYSIVAQNGLGDFAQTLCVIVPLFALICIGLIAKIRFPLALASNISLVYSGLLLYGLYLANSPGAGVKLSAMWGPSLLLAGSVLLASFLSSATSHRAYWRELFS